jgi:hypothetical protein
MMQEHRSKPAACQPANTSKRAFNGKERGATLSILKFEISIIIVRMIDPKSMHVHRLR